MAFPGKHDLASVFGITALLLATVASASAEPNTYRLLHYGDSWSAFMCGYGSLRSTFDNNGLTWVQERFDNTVFPGATAAELARPENIALAVDELRLYPTIDTAQIYVGGNDLLDGADRGGWYVGISEEDFQLVLDRIATDIGTIIDGLHAERPDLVILLGGYDYPNFEDTATGFFCGGYLSDMGNPTTRQVNDATVRLEALLTGVASTHTNVVHFSNLGLMQYTFGFPAESIAPFTILPPGDPDRPSPIEAMGSLFGQPDCIHLNPAGYDAIAQNYWEQFYRDRFTPKSVAQDLWLAY